MNKFVSHIHTKYSHDCRTEIPELLERCKKIDVKYLLISDHDVYGLTDNDEKLFSDSGIIIIRAIEFTTIEKIHIIGVAKKIKTLEKPMGSYSALDIVVKVKSIGGQVIVPHPTHKTGLLGNNLEEELIKKVLAKADFIEAYSHKYGRAKFNYGKPVLYGDDAHTAVDVGNCYNRIISDASGGLSGSKFLHRKTIKYYLRRIFQFTVSSSTYQKIRTKPGFNQIIKYVKIFKR